jgi:hypothetical protein
MPPEPAAMRDINMDEKYENVSTWLASNVDCTSGNPNAELGHETASGTV